MLPERRPAFVPTHAIGVLVVQEQGVCCEAQHTMWPALRTHALLDSCLSLARAQLSMQRLLHAYQLNAKHCEK